jgi:Xaa-Pro aminopeptidase
VPFHPIIKSGPNSLWAWRILASHYDRRNRAVRDGELVIFDVGCELDHYVSDVGRTVPVSGKFTPAQARAIDAQRRVADAIIDAIRPGVTLAAVTEAGRDAISPEMRPYMQTGSFYSHHLGLSTGDPVLTDEPLRAGMVFTVEPWYYNHDDGISVFVEDMVLVTDEGVEILTGSLPRTVEGLEDLVGRR